MLRLLDKDVMMFAANAERFTTERCLIAKSDGYVERHVVNDIHVATVY